MRGHGQHRDGFRLLGRLAQRPGPTPMFRARLREQQAGLLASVGQPAKAAERYSDALDLLVGDISGPADAVRIRCLEARAGCCADPVDDRRTGDLHAALLLTLRAGDRLAEGRLRVHLAQDAGERARPGATASWYRSALAPAREAEDWAALIAVLGQLASHGSRMGRDGEAQALRDERDLARRDAGDLAFLGPAAPARDGVLAAARDTLLARAPANLFVLAAAPRNSPRCSTMPTGSGAGTTRPADALARYYSALPLCLERADADELSGCLTGMGSAFETLAGNAAGDALRSREDPGGEWISSVRGGDVLRLAARPWQRPLRPRSGLPGRLTARRAGAGCG